MLHESLAPAAPDEPVMHKGHPKVRETAGQHGGIRQGGGGGHWTGGAHSGPAAAGRGNPPCKPGTGVNGRDPKVFAASTRFRRTLK